MRLLLVVAILLVCPAAVAQRQTDRLVLPVPSLTGTDDATSLVVNPANLAFLESYSLYYLHSEIVSSDDPIVGRGDGIYAATPLLFGTALAVGFEHLRPPRVLGFSNRGALDFGLSYGIRSMAALGLSVRTYFSAQDLALDGLTAWDAGLTLRPWPFLSFAVAARDFNAPAYRGTSIPRRWVLGLGVRPTGRDAVQVTGEVSIDERSGTVTPAASIAAQLPWVGAIRAGFELPENPVGAGRELRAQVALEVTTPHLGAGGAVSTRRDEVSAWTAYARISGERYRGLPRPARVVDVTVEGSIDVRASTALARRLDGLRQDDTVDGVLLRVRGAEVSLAAAQEMRRRIKALQRTGRKVVCHLDDASANAYALCTAADQIFVDPAGGVRLQGLRTQIMFFRELLDHLGVRAEFVKIGEYKSAPEAFERTHSSEAARRESETLLDDYTGQVVGQIAADRRIPAARVRALFDQGPFVTPEAIRAGLVNGSIYEDQIDVGLRKAFGRTVNLVSPPSAPARPTRWGTPSRIAVVYVDGDIVDGRSFTIPLLDMRFVGGRTTVEAIQQAAADPSVGAIVLRIDSPGGSALASDHIWRAVWQARQVKPVIASMESIAASGGYYIASAANEIIADPATLTGSIGIFFGKFDLSGLLDRIGINIQTFRRGRRADFESLYRGFTSDERRMVQQKMWHFYNIFLRKVARGRGRTTAEIDAVGRGRVWSGQRARVHHLIDSFGGISEALWRARVLANLPEDYDLYELPEEGGLLQTILGLAGVHAGEGAASVVLPEGIRSSLRMAAPLLYAPADQPMALLPYAISTP